MVKKLLKHELIAIFRVLVFLMAAVIIFAVLGRIMLAASLKNETGTGTMLTLLLIMFYIFAIFALVFTAWGLGVSRFYKSLFTGEGYMTFSLPATPMQLVIAKLLSSIIAMAAATVVSVLSASIFMMGWEASVIDMLTEAFGELAELLRMAIEAEPILILEWIVSLIVSIPMSMLVVYSIISVGQLFTSHRKGMTWLIAFGVYFVWSILSTLVIDPAFTAIADSVGGTASAHLSTWLDIILTALIDVGCFFLIRYILRNKVNLIA